ncbi:MAG TPA: 50S ribosomal protein L25 [Candidatus Yonathbacteria bacterium]|nr:50S ribosomal protein L25 [Candidatus Yonathbacteria bacterium]
MLTLKAEIREATEDSSSLRAAGKVPAVFYGSKEKTTISISVENKEFVKALKEAGESSVITLDTSKGKKGVLIHEVQFDPVTDKPIHVDFYVVDQTKEVEVAVPIEFIGVSPAVKELGGILVKIMHEIEIKALPQDLPTNIKVDISILIDFSSRILVKDLKLPKGVIATANLDDAVANISEAKEEVEEAPAEIDMDAVEVEKKGKKEEESGEEASE